MNRYINSEKLKTRLHNSIHLLRTGEPTNEITRIVGERHIETYEKLLEFIESIEQEWSEEDEKKYKVVLELLNSWANGTIGGCIIPPNTDRYISWFKSLPERFNLSPKQEWPEVDLDAMLTGFMGRYAFENGGEYPSAIDIARYFYELGIARKEK